MAAKILQISDEFRDSLEETLDRNDCTRKVRPYYYGVPYEDKMILIPLRSNCPRSYSMLIYNTGNRKRPGLDFCKMIIMSRNEVAKNASKAIVNGNVMHDLERKHNQIMLMTQKIIMDYKLMKSKLKRGLDLTSDEQFLKMRSTLRNWEDVI